MTAPTVPRVTQKDMEDALVDLRVSFAHEGRYLAACLTRLADLMDAHIRVPTTAAFLEDLVLQEPRLAAQIAELQADHREIPARLDDLRERLHALLKDGAEVCDRVLEHHRRGQHLMYEAFMSDLGGSG